jgi:hypothetical protein
VNSIDQAPLTCYRGGIASSRIWPHLRKLSLAYFGISIKDLTELLVSHAETLEDLRMRNVRLLQDHGSDASDTNTSRKSKGWIGLWTEAREVLHLKSARFRGFLFSTLPRWSSDESILWRMEEDAFGGDVAKFRVDGGSCPLTKENIYVWDPFEFDDSDDSVNSDDSDQSA